MKAKLLTIQAILLIAGLALVVTGGVSIWLCLREPMFHASGTFVLHPRDGHPMVCSSGKRIHFNWDGDPLMITPGDVPPGVHQTEFKRIRELTSTVKLADTTIEVDGDVIATALGPTVPDGWRRCMAVTVGQGRREKIVSTVTETDGSVMESYKWDAYAGLVLDYETGGLLNETDLFPLSRNRKGESRRDTDLTAAEIVRAYIGPEEGIGLAVRFQCISDIYPDGEFSWHGLLSTAGWRPSCKFSCTPGRFPGEHEMVVGPGDRYIWCMGQDSSRPMLDFFYSQKKAPVFQDIVCCRHPAFVDTIAGQLLKTLISVFVFSMLCAAILTGSWHFLLPRRGPV